MENNQRIELLKDLFTLIHPELVVKRSSQAERANEERKNRVQAWLTDTVQAASQEENPWKEQDKGRGDQLSLLPRFMQLLRECILTHQWTQVLSMLKCLSHIPYGADWATWKATLTALYTEPESNVSFIQEFFKHSYLLKECNVCDVALEFAQYLISQGMTQEASKVIQTARRGNPRDKSEYERELTQHCMKLLDGYQGLVFYMDWKAAISRQQQWESLSSHSNSQMSQSFYSLTSSQGPSEDAIRNIAKRATLGLDALLRKSGVWDIFLTKSVEIHEFYGDFGKAEKLLCMYRDRNPDNPNAHKFLYEHLTRNCAHHNETYVNEESVRCLKSLAKLDPANPLVLTLWQKLTDGGDSSEALCYVFDLLDYELWRDRAEGWRCLAKSLAAGLSREKSQEERNAFLSALVSCWSSRKDWWLEYHFVGSMVSHADQSSPDLLLSSKVIVAAVLIGKDCHFNTEAREVLNTSSRQLLNNMLSDLDWDTVTEFIQQHGSPFTRLSETPVNPSIPASFLCGDHTATPVSSASGRTKRKKTSQGSGSFTDTGTLCPESSETRNSPLTGSGGGGFVSPDEGHSSDSVGSDFSLSGSARVGLSSSELSSPETGREEQRVGTIGGRKYKRAKRKRTHTDTGSSAFKNWDISDDISYLPEQETFEDTTSTSSRRKRQKRRAEDVDDGHFAPLKRRRKEK